MDNEQSEREDTQKVVINTKYGGFGLSKEAYEWLIENRGWEVTQYEDGSYADETADIVDRTAGPDASYTRFGGKYVFVGMMDDPELRTDDDLIECVETLGSDANGDHARLKIVEVPTRCNWKIQAFDGVEQIVDEDRVWR